MATRSPAMAHVRNMLRHPLESLRFIFDFGVKRVLARGRKPPGFFVANPANHYPFQYHAEHLPHLASCVRLTDDVDDLGMPKLDIDIAFTDEDIDGVLQADDTGTAACVRAASGGFRVSCPEARSCGCRAGARTGGGFHQIGTTRMSKDPQDGVVDENLAVHGVSNVHVASSSVFVTSGQANSTFMIVVFAIRLIERLYGDR